MARLKLKDGQTYQNVGAALLEMAEAVRRDSPDQPFSATRGADLSGRFQDLFDERFVDAPPTLREAEDLPIEDGVRLVFHFDRTVTEKDRTMRVVNVAVPDLTGKPATAEDNGLSGIAREAIGFLTICGCVG